MPLFLVSKGRTQRMEEKNMKMNKLIIFLFLISTVLSCSKNAKRNIDVTAETSPITKSETITIDTTPKVTGIGGIFFFSDNPAKTKEWYGKNLGLEINSYGSVFEFRNTKRPDEKNYLCWTPFQKGSNYFAPSKKEFMINYRVQNIEGMVKKLKGNGVTVLDKIETYDYGKFVHLIDQEGNKIELWEPVDSVFTKMGGKTTK
jgi:predicted enzyme related to lactoylglutathione lyase